MILEQLEILEKKMEQACLKSGRNRKEVKLVLVSKGVASDLILEAYECGVRNFGENRVQELIQKKASLPRDIRWHMIGHLQTNKIKDVIGQVCLIHSCDRLNVAHSLELEGEKQSQVIDLLIQVNTTGEISKQGFEASEVVQAVSEVKQHSHLNIRGLMTIGPLKGDAQEIHTSFKSLRLLRDELKKQYPDIDWHYLSMGMSHDFEIAIEEGANLVRIGTAVFGERKLLH